MKAKARQAVCVVVLLLIVVGGGLYIYWQRERFAVLLMVPVAGVAALLAARLCARSIEALTLRLVLTDMGRNVGVFESNALSWTTIYWNYLPMKAGTGAMAVYMKRRHGLPYGQFVVYAFTVQLVRMLGLGVIGLAASLPLLRAGLPAWIPLLFAGAVIGTLAAAAVPVRWRYEGDRFVLRALWQMSHAWDLMRTRRGLLVRVAAWKAAQMLLNGFGVYLTFRLVGLEIGLGQAVIMFLLQSLTFLVPVVPAGLGIREALGGGIGVVFGFPFAESVVAHTLGRAVSLFLVLTLGPLASHHVFVRFFPGAEAAPRDTDTESATIDETKREE